MAEELDRLRGEMMRVEEGNVTLTGELRSFKGLRERYDDIKAECLTLQ